MTDSQERAAKRDLGFIGIIALVIGVAIWLLLMPLVPAIASVTLHRFHLRTDSFAGWAIQAPIPSMYNFANRFEVRDFPPGMVDPIFFEGAEKRYINHFPVRRLTFADARYYLLRQGQDRWLTVDSTYRGQTLESRFHARHIGEGRFELIRLADPGDHSD